jgi:hypothetical protein
VDHVRAEVNGAITSIREGREDMTISALGPAATANYAGHAQALRQAQPAPEVAAQVSAPIDSDGDRDASTSGGRLDVKA